MSLGDCVCIHCGITYRRSLKNRALDRRKRWHWRERGNRDACAWTGMNHAWSTEVRVFA